MANDVATHSSPPWTRRARVPSSRSGIRPGARSGTGRPGRYRAGLPCEPGRRFCQDLALLTQLAVLTAQTGHLSPLRLRKPIIAAASTTFGLAHPIPDRLRRWLELA